MEKTEKMEKEKQQEVKQLKITLKGATIHVSELIIEE
jgi:hypothetical protein